MAIYFKGTLCLDQLPKTSHFSVHFDVIVWFVLSILCYHGNMAASKWILIAT